MNKHVQDDLEKAKILKSRGYEDTSAIGSGLSQADDDEEEQVPSKRFEVKSNKSNVYDLKYILLVLLLLFAISIIYIISTLKEEINDMKGQLNASMQANQVGFAKQAEKEDFQNESALHNKIFQLQSQLYQTQVLLLEKEAARTKNGSISKLNTTKSSQNDEKCPDVDFKTVALKYGTDKVTVHQYDKVYKKYFAPVRCDPIKILEIGLGCIQAYGVGASYHLWLDYFPNADIYFIEYEEKCVEAWINKNDRVHIHLGDQSDPQFLIKFISDTGGQFDFIVDDGGHKMNQQITSLEMLFPAVKPGGIYFIEDLVTSYIGPYGGAPGAPSFTTVGYIHEILEDLMTRESAVQDQKKASFVYDVVTGMWRSSLCLYKEGRIEITIYHTIIMFL